MTDLDFDELDRAVNSALGVTAPDGTASPAAVVSTPSAADPVAVPASQLDASSSPATSTPSIAPAAKRSSGRFMDVVHPSSDMRASSPRPSVPAERPVPTTFTPPVVSAPAATPAPQSEWPDPIDFHNSQHEQGAPADFEQSMSHDKEPLITPDNPDLVPDAIEAPSEFIETPTASEVAPDPDEPLNSPFISDAKVEKRPLGAFSDTVKPDETPEQSESVDTAISDTNPNIDEATDNDTLFPAELESKLLSIESKPAVAESFSEPVAPAEPVAVEPTPAIVSSPAATEDPVPTVPSIVQQYKERPSTAEQPSGAIFDTENYHKPLAHPAKKKGSWFIILWIIGLGVIGCGVGLVVYKFVLPLL